MAAKKAAKKVTSKRKTTKKVIVPNEANDFVMDVSQEKELIDTSKVKGMSAKTKLAFILAFIVIVFALYKGKGLLIAATVNGEPVNRLEIVTQLEKRFGKQALDSIISEKIVEQEAKKQNITLSADVISSEMAKIEESVKSQGGDLNTLLTAQGLSRADLEKQIQTQKLVEKILGDKINPKEEEINDYIKNNKDFLPKDKKPEEIKQMVVEQLKQQNLSVKFQEWITEAKKNANVKYFVTY